MMEAALQVDPSLSMDEAEARALAADEADTPMTFRQCGRVWTKTKFEAYLEKLRKQKRVKATELYQLPH